MDSQPAVVSRGSPFGANGPYVGSLFTTALGIPSAVKRVMRMSGMAFPFCMGCGERSHRLDTCSVFTLCEDKEYIAEIAAKYAATILGCELNHFSTSASVHGYLDYASERWRGKRVCFKSLLSFARASSKRHPSDVGDVHVGEASGGNVAATTSNQKAAAATQERESTSTRSRMQRTVTSNSQRGSPRKSPCHSLVKRRRIRDRAARTYRATVPSIHDGTVKDAKALLQQIMGKMCSKQQMFHWCQSKLLAGKFSYH